MWYYQVTCVLIGMGMDGYEMWGVLPLFSEIRAALCDDGIVSACLRVHTRYGINWR